MGFFRDVGRRVERFKSEVEAVADGQASFACTACGHRLHTDHETCPECGADAVEPLVDPESEADSDSDSDSDSGSDSVSASASDDENPPDEPEAADTPADESTDPDRT